MTPTSAPGPSSLAGLKAKTSALAGVWVAEIVLQTNQYDLMRAWYEAVLGRDAFFQTRADPVPKPKPRTRGDKQVFAKDVRACFIKLATVAPYDLTLALFELPDLNQAPDVDPGLNHMQLKHPNLDQLVQRMEFLLDAGLLPHRSANHGPGTSFYFRDPDSNIVELTIDNFASPEEFAAFVASDAFKANPSGIELDAAEFIGRYRAGVPAAELLAI